MNLSIASTTQTGSNFHGFGIMDNQGREIGANVIYSVVELVEYDKGFMVQADKPGTYLKTIVHAARDGQNYGSAFTCEHHIIEGYDGEAVATDKRNAFVAKRLTAIRKLAEKKAQ